LVFVSTIHAIKLHKFYIYLERLNYVGEILLLFIKYSDYIVGVPTARKGEIDADLPLASPTVPYTAKHSN